MHLDTFDIPLSRKEFEYRMNLLEAMIREGRMVFSSQCIGAIDGLTKVRRMENGRIDLLSVDESARLQANMMTMNLDLPDIEKEWYNKT